MYKWYSKRREISSIAIITIIILPLMSSFVFFWPDERSSANPIGHDAFTGDLIGRNAFTGPVVVYPSNNTVFSEPFEFRVDVYDENFANITYRVDWMTSHLFMRNTSTMIDIDEWNALSNGSHLIQFIHTNLLGGYLEAYLPFEKAAQTPGTDPPDLVPPYALITWVAIIASICAILAIVLVQKTRPRRNASPAGEETEAARRRELDETRAHEEIPMPEIVNKLFSGASPVAPVKAPPAPAFCPRCGNPIPQSVEKIRFCVFCGEKVVL